MPFPFSFYPSFSAAFFLTQCPKGPTRQNKSEKQGLEFRQATDNRHEPCFYSNKRRVIFHWLSVTK